MITAASVKELRDKTNAGMMDCQKVLTETNGDIEASIKLLRERGIAKAGAKADRAAKEGIIAARVNSLAESGILLEVNCETDFVARTEIFQEMAHCLAMQVAAMNPQYISEKDIPEGKEKDVVPAEVCLMLQPYIKDPTKTISDVVTETITKTGENIQVGRFIRYELGG